MQQTRNNKDFKGGRYARTDDELYKKAVTLLEKCKIETQYSGREIPELDYTAA